MQKIRLTINGVILDYYDVAFESCNITKSLENRLGYARIYIAGKDVKVLDGKFKGNEIEDSIIFNSSNVNILSVIGMHPKAIVFPDSRINKKAMEQMREKDILLCLPMSLITSASGMSRSKSLYMMSKLFDHARSIKLDVAFVTLAKSNSDLCSYMQTLELAKLIGADEAYARKSLSEINKSLVNK